MSSNAPSCSLTSSHSGSLPYILALQLMTEDSAGKQKEQYCQHLENVRINFVPLGNYLTDTMEKSLGACLLAPSALTTSAKASGLPMELSLHFMLHKRGMSEDIFLSHEYVPNLPDYLILFSKMELTSSCVQFGSKYSSFIFAVLRFIIL